MDNELIGKHIKKLRIENNMSQEELASKLFVDRTLISKWENGKLIPETKNIVSLSKLFNTTIDELVNGEEKEIKDDTKLIYYLFIFSLVVVIIWIIIKLIF